MSRGRKTGPETVRLSISATDEEWAAVRQAAVRRGLSISRYLVGAALANAPAPKAGPAPALDDREERKLLELIRRLQPLLLEPDDQGSPPRELLGWLRTVMEAWASALAGFGRAGDVHPVLAPVPGEGSVDRTAADHASETQPAAAAPKKPKQSGRRANSGPGPGKQGALF